MVSTETKEWLAQLKQRLHQDPDALGAFASMFRLPAGALMAALESELGPRPRGLQGKELADVNRAMGVKKGKVMASTGTKEWLAQLKQHLHQDPEALGAFVSAFNIIPAGPLLSMLEEELGPRPRGLQGKELAAVNRAMGVGGRDDQPRVWAGRLTFPSLTPSEMRARLARRG